ncbi:15099_t:CDS:2 [Funneliformis geosporum]|nr:15099_t:CDS:2 [Funneliformis geosporum]
MGKVTVGGHWLVEEKIGEGSFGEVFRAVHIKTNEQYAIKRELVDEDHPQLPQEAEFLRRLAGPSYIPKVYWFGQEQLYNALVMDLLGPNIRLVRQAYGKLPIPFVSKISIQMVDILEHVHSRGIVYRDVKPDNFLLERDFAISIKELEKWNSEKDSPKLIEDKHPLLYSPHKISLVDFGRHVPKKHPPTKYKTGTARYAAMGVHRGLPHARRDDLESLGYVILELLQGTLPWAGVTARNAVEGWSKMLKMKESKPLEELFEGVPSGFMKFLQYARSLDFDQKPDYAYARNLLAATCRNGYDSELVSLEFEDYSSARPMSPAPLTPANESSFWSDDNAFRDFDGGFHSDEWINHNDDSALKAVVSAWGDGNVKVPWLEDSYPTRNNCHPRYNDELYNQDVIRTRSLNTKQTREWRELQSRRPSTPSPLSISIPPRPNSSTNSPRGVTSPNNKFEHMQHYPGVDENIPLGPRRSIPNIRNTNSLATKFLKRSVPNLRDQAHYNIVTQPSSTIKRTMAHMQETLPTVTTQGRKGTLNNNSTSPPRCYSFKDNTHNSTSPPREEISNTTNGNSSQNVRFSPQDARFSLKDGKYSPQDARFSSRDNFRGRERASTFSQFSNVQKQDNRYPPISTSPIVPSRQGSKPYKERERSYTFTSGHNPPVSPGIQNNSPNGTYFFQPNVNNWSSGKRERSSTFTNGGKAKDYNYGGKNGCYERRNYMNGPPQNHSQQNSGYNRNGTSIHVQKSQNNNNRQNQQEEENYPPRSTSTTPTSGHRRSNSREKVELRNGTSEINNETTVTSPSATTETFFDSIDQKVSSDMRIPRDPNSLDKETQTPSNPDGTGIEDALNNAAVNKSANHQQNHHVSFATKLEDNYSYYPNRPSSGYRRQSYSAVCEDKSSRTRSLTFPDIRQNIKNQNDSNGFWKSATTVNGKNPRPVLKNNNQSVTPKLPNGNVHFQDSDGKKKKKKSKWTYYKVNL